MKSITVSVSAEGEVTIEAIGFKGQACTKATEALEKAMGQIKNRKHKPDFYQKTTLGAQIKQ